MTTMTVFTAERRELIAKMKRTIKARSYKGGLSYAHFILYAALRGQDIRKTSHLPDGDNAREVIKEMESNIGRFKGWIRLYPFGALKDENGNPFFTEDDADFLRSLCFEIRQTMESSMKQAS